MTPDLGGKATTGDVAAWMEEPWTVHTEPHPACAAPRPHFPPYLSPRPSLSLDREAIQA